ncbi:TolC family protein [Geovibrio thiophilus]|uniref:TolC family protein n=1 Tax=Geovibrio thiophilus TaxID=139438 RepID=A0A410JY32_9BACT|nr:TolC family protein [Geovibrio thiophilus]QAR33074.1 TolC family protein [Geovibrio thiophilus]
MIKKTAAAAFCLTFAVSAHALTLDEAVNKALANNHEITEYRYLTEQKENQVGTARSPFLPQLDATYGYQRSNEDNKYGLDKNQASSADVTVGYNLFRGGADTLNLRAAKSSLEAQKFMEESIKSDVVLDVKKAFFNILQAKKDVEAAKESVALLESQLKDAQLNYEVGISPKNEVLRVEAELASQRQALLQAQSTENTAVFELERLVNENIPADETYQDFAVPANQEMNSLSLFDSLKANRSELKYVRELVKAQNYTADATRRGGLPSVSVSASYNSYGDDAKPADRETSYDDEVIFGASATWSIFDGNARRSTAAAEKAYAMSLKHQELKTTAQMKYQLENALEQYSLATGSLTVAEKEVESAEENYRITENQYKQRVATATDLLDARVMLTRARNNYNKALYDIYKAMAEIERVVEQKVF